MAVSYQSSDIVVANWGDNACRWEPESRGHYEVWFLTLNHRATQRGFWFRYTITSPSASAEPSAPVAELWAGYFDRNKPGDNFVIRREYETNGLGLRRNGPVAIAIGESGLSASRVSGAVEAAGHSVNWDLTFVPNQTTYHHVSPAVVKLL
jgi:hypothetical protein